MREMGLAAESQRSGAGEERYGERIIYKYQLG